MSKKNRKNYMKENHKHFKNQNKEGFKDAKKEHKEFVKEEKKLNEENKLNVDEEINNPSCDCNNSCNCGENCNCGDDCNCSEDCKCGDDCNCSEGCKCGEDCHCADEAKKEIEILNQKLQKEKDDYLRLLAEFETFRSRTAEQRLQLISSASSDVIKGLLPVLDDCERALQLLEQSSDANAKEGTALIYDKLMAYLKSKGLEVIESKGKKFDTDFHEAVAQIPAGEEQKGCVVDVIETGYTLNGSILRFAKVVVGV